MVSNLGVRPVVDSESESQQTFHPTKGRGLFHPTKGRGLFHRWMKRCQAATLGLVVGFFVMALWVSINWKQVTPFEIAFWWMLFALSGIPLTIFVGLDIIAAALAWGGFVLTLMVATFSTNWDLLRVTISIFGALLGVVIVFKIFSSLVRDLSRMAAK